MNVLTDILDFLMPRRCIVCGMRLAVNERHLCTACYARLPFTQYHQVEHSPLEKQFWGLFPVGRAVSMFHHDGEKTRQIIYHIKYWRHPEVGYHLAQQYAEVLKAESLFFDDIDAIIPLPLHWQRQLKRHYNQSHIICQGISKQTGIPVYRNVVRRVRNNPSQTRLTAQERIKNVKGIFCLVHPEKVEGKHVLLVDDVTTTGATLASCAQELSRVPGVTISILTLAVASRTSLPVPHDEAIDASVFGVPLINE